MSASKFEELVREYAKRTDGSEAATHRQARIKAWQRRVEGLLNDIDHWLLPLIQSGSLTTRRDEVDVHEENLGNYPIASEVIELGARSLTLRPAGTLVVGALGRVDISGPNGRALLLLVPGEEKSELIEDRMTQASWSISHPAKAAKAQRRELRPLTQETFQDLFADLFGIG
jgi:hypothetical protein